MRPLVPSTSPRSGRRRPRRSSGIPPGSGGRGLALLPAAVVLLVCSLVPASVAAQGGGDDGRAAAPSTDAYVPGPGEAWERRSPADVGMDAELLDEAVRFARDHETAASPDLEQNHYTSFGREPFGEAVGPFRTRGPQTGVVVRHGYLVAEWGEPRRVDMTFSVSKSFLSTVVGLALERGLISDLSDPVAASMAPVDLPEGDGERGVERRHFGEPDPVTLFDSEHARRITWEHLLRQTSAWQGTLWGKPDWADRPDGDPSGWIDAEPAAPGTEYEYNDVRVNLLALAATNVWRRPLPEVLREHVMDPVGASPTWRWHGYRNSWITLDGRRVQVVSGGGHWGGGMFLSARDQARFGLWTLRRGRWGDRQLLGEEWFRRATTPGAANDGYGFMNYFLNTDRRRFPAAPESAYAHLGSGTNMVYVDPDHDLVVVARWIEGGAVAELVERVLDAVDAGDGSGGG